MSALYLDSSAVLRVTLEKGTTPELEARLLEAEALISSRLSLVETSRALIRARELGRISEVQHVDVEGRIDDIWSRCHIWELTRGICARAQSVAPRTGLRTLDAIHLATFLEVRRSLGGQVDLVAADERLLRAVGQP